MLVLACEVEWHYVQTSQRCDVPANQVAEIGYLKIASANSRIATCSAFAGPVAPRSAPHTCVHIVRFLEGFEILLIRSIIERRRSVHASLPAAYPHMRIDWDISIPHTLTHFAGWDAKLDDVVRRLRCSQCHQKRCTARAVSMMTPRGYKSH